MTLFGATDPLEQEFSQPPDSTKPRCYWYWMDGQISKDGITRDMEAMKRVGIGEAFIGNISFGNNLGEAVVLSDTWWQMTEHAIREAGRIGVNIGIFNCPGFSQSGGPWIKPEQSMRYLATSETRVTGPKHFVGKLAAPKTPFQDVAVLAFPAQPLEADTLAAHAARITVAPAVKDAARLIDGNSATAAAIAQNQNSKPVTVDIELGTPLTARSLMLCPARSAFSMDCELLAQDGTGNFKRLRSFRYERERDKNTVGFMPHGPVAIEFPATTSSHFRLVCSEFIGNRTMELAEIQLT